MDDLSYTWNVEEFIFHKKYIKNKDDDGGREIKNNDSIEHTVAQLALASKLKYKFIQGYCHYVRRGGVKESDGQVKAKEG